MFSNSGTGFEIVGFDRYGGSSRWLRAQPDGPLVAISVQGSDGDAEVMLTPDQAMTISRELHGVAEQASEQANGVTEL